MSVEGLINKLVEYFTWLYYERQWALWEQVTIAVIALVLLLLIARRRRKRTARRIYANRIREHSPIIGLGSAGRSGIKSIRFRWKRCLLIVMFAFVSFFVLPLWMLDQVKGWIAKPAGEVTAADVMQAKSLFQREEAINTKTEMFNQKYKKLHQKYRNQYALLPVSGVFMELLGFDPKQESSLYKNGYEDANHLLPDWAVGEYGVITPRRIVQILGLDEMLVAGFISEDGRVVHFKGWPTNGIVSGQPWPFNPHSTDPNEETKPIEVAVVGTYRYGTIIGEAKTVPSAVPLELFRKGITLEQFKDLLLIKKDLPEDLLRFKSEILGLEMKYSDKPPTTRTQAKL